MQWFRDRRLPGRPAHPDVLTPAEWRVLDEVRRGRSNPEIAAALGVSVNTVRTHVPRMLAKLELPDRHALAAWDGRPAAIAAPAAPEVTSNARRRTTTAALALGGAAVAVAAVVLLFASMQGASAPSAEEPPPPLVGATETATPEVTAEATPVALVDGLPVGVRGPLLVYRREVGSADAASRRWPRVAVVTVDLSTGREIASFEVGEAGAYLQSIALVGREVFVDYEHTLAVYALNGERSRVLREAPSAPDTDQGRFDGFAASPDGSLVAITERSFGRPFDGSAVVVIDSRTGDDVLTVPGDHPGFEGIRGELRPVVWRDDGAGLVADIVTNPEAGTSLATVMLDGTVRLHDTFGFTYLSRDGRRVAHGTGSLGCMFISGHSIIVTDLDTGAVTATVDDESRTFLIREWSGDGSELLYASRPYPEDRAERDACEWPAAEPDWFLLPAHGGDPIPLDGPHEAHERWYGEAAVTFMCDGEQEAGWYSRFNLMLRAPDRCLASNGPASEIVYEGIVIGAGHSAWVLGQIDVDDP